MCIQLLSDVFFASHSNVQHAVAAVLRVRPIRMAVAIADLLEGAADAATDSGLGWSQKDKCPFFCLLARGGQILLAWRPLVGSERLTDAPPPHPAD
jgi:hypothetical protein